MMYLTMLLVHYSTIPITLMIKSSVWAQWKLLNILIKRFVRNSQISLLHWPDRREFIQGKLKDLGTQMMIVLDLNHLMKIFCMLGQSTIAQLFLSGYQLIQRGKTLLELTTTLLSISIT